MPGEERLSGSAGAGINPNMMRSSAIEVPALAPGNIKTDRMTNATTITAVSREHFHF